MVGVIPWTVQPYASQGGLLFPCIAAISSLLAIGLGECFSILLTVAPLTPNPFAPRKRRERGADVDGGRFSLAVPSLSESWSTSSPSPFAERAAGSEVNHAVRNALLPLAIFGLFALVTPFAIIAPAYAPPLPQSALPDTAHKVYARFGDVALMGYSTPDQRYGPDQNVPITLYWQVINRSSRDLSLYLHAVDSQANVIGRIDSYPGAGRLRTTTWEPGAVYADTYAKIGRAHV